jgi:tetratricopeptide (TPR) repeat protein
VTRLTAALLALILLVLPAAGAEKESRLDSLFQRLQSTANPAEAQLTEVMIWQLWSEADDKATDTLMQLGMATLQKGDLAGALSLFDAVTARKPDFAEGWNKRATVFYLLGAYDKSVEDIGRVLALEPRHFGALSGLGMINAKLEREDAALAAFEQALKVNPHMPGVKASVEELRKKRSKGAI